MRGDTLEQEINSKSLALDEILEVVSRLLVVSWLLIQVSMR